MSTADFETHIYHLLYDFFRDHDFELLVPLRQFRRRFEGGFQNAIFSFSTYEQEHWLEVNVGVRIEPIEQIAQQFLDNFREYRAESNTLIISVGRLNREKYFRYRATSAEEADLAGAQIMEFMTGIGFPFLEQIAGLEQVEKVLNARPDRPCEYLYNQTHRCFKGLIAARLCNRPNVALLAEKYRHQLGISGAGESVLADYERLCRFILHYSPN